MDIESSVESSFKKSFNANLFPNEPSHKLVFLFTGKLTDVGYVASRRHMFSRRHVLSICKFPVTFNASVSLFYSASVKVLNSTPNRITTMN
jgi:hypothetical protein